MSRVRNNPDIGGGATPATTAFVVFDIGKNVHAMAVYAGYELQVQVKPEYVMANQAGFARAGDVIGGYLEDSW